MDSTNGYVRFVALMLMVVLAMPNRTSTAAVQASELALFEDIPVVFSASRIEEPIYQAPSAISIITAKDLKDWGIVDLPDAFRFVPGMDVTAYNGREWGVTARGFNERFARRMLVLIDGMSVYTPLDSGVPWADIPLLIEDIEKIEVIRGPNDTLYGFNAFNGVINITTKTAQDSSGFLGKYLFGSHRRNQFIGRYGDSVDLGSLGELSFWNSYSFHENQGYGQDHGDQYPDYRHVHVVTGRAAWTMTDAMNLEFMYGINAGPNGQGSLISSGSGFRENSEFYYQLTKLNFSLFENHRAHLQFYHWYRIEDAKIRGSGNLDSSDKRERQYDFEMQNTFSLLDDRSQTVFGVSYRTNEVHALVAGRNNNNTMNTLHDNLFSVYLNEKFLLLENKKGIDSLSLNAGVRTEGSRFTGTDWAPRAALIYEPIDKHAFRISYARAFRLPSFVEERGTAFVPDDTGAILRLLGNRDVKREQVHSFEAGYSGLFVEDRATVDIDAFFSNYQGLIRTQQLQALSFVPSMPQIVSFNNTSEARSLGIEVATSYRFNKVVKAFANYSWQNILGEGDFSTQGIDFSPSHPEHKANLGLLIEFHEDTIEPMPFLKNVTVNLLGNYRDSYIEFNSQDGPRSQTKIKSNIRFDFKVSKSFFDGGLELAFIGQNILGPNHFEAGFVEVPQLYFGSITLQGWPWALVKKKEEQSQVSLSGI